MATSLARQLALLRTPGAVKSSLASASSVYSGPFIIPEAEAEHNSVASLKGAVAESLSALCSLDPEMMRFTVLLELEEEDEAARRLVRECLTALCPHILNKHAQWVLQWLFIRHKVTFIIWRSVTCQPFMPGPYQLPLLVGVQPSSFLLLQNLPDSPPEH